MYKAVDYGRYCWQCKNFSKNEDEEPCYDCMAHPLNDDSYKPIHFDKAEQIKKLPYDKIEYLRPYTYEAHYTDLDYAFAKSYYESLSEVSNFNSCSAFRKGDFIGRNLDWTYDCTPEYVVRTPAKDSRHAVLGIASGFKDLDDGSEPNDKYKVLPFQLYDGINDTGVTASILVVPTDKGSSPSQPIIQQKDRINGLMLVRYILDNFASAKEAVEYIRDYVCVYFSTKYTQEYNYIIHYFVADMSKTYGLEFADSQTKIFELNGGPYMTNFYLYDCETNADGSVYTPLTRTESNDPVTTNKITNRGSGLERYNLINSKWPFITSISDCKNLLKDLWYTNSYKGRGWLTEFVTETVGCDAWPIEFDSIMREAERKYKERTRETGLTWHTVHSSIYDIASKTLRISFQEEDVWRTYSL